MLVLQSHYRAPIEVTPTTLSDAVTTLGRLDALSDRLDEAGGAEPGGIDPEVRQAFVDRMQDDLDTPGATAVLFDAIRRANVAFDSREPARAGELTGAVLECFRAVGLEAKGAVEIPDTVLELGRRRDGRVLDDIAAADLLRSEIVALGYIVEDTSSGTRIRR